MEYMKVSEVAKKWDISTRRVRVLCSEGKIEGVIRKGNLYMIPIEAKKPKDGRCNKECIHKKTMDKILKLENELDIQNNNLKELQESMDALDKARKAVVSSKLEQMVSTMQKFSSKVNSVIQSDSMQNLINIAQYMGNVMKSFDYSSVLGNMYEAMIPFRYINLLEQLGWPIFLIDDDKLRQEILDVCENGENLEKVTEIIYSYCTDEFIDNMEKDWLKCDVIDFNRKLILSEAMLMHKQEHYYASTSMLMCQVYGVAADIQKILEKNGFKLDEDEKFAVAEMFELNRKYIDKEKGRLFQSVMYTESGMLLWNAMVKYMKNTCFYSKEDYTSKENQPLRNKVCHGEQLDFGTKEHSLKAILVIDMLVQLAYEINRVISIRNK